MSDKLVPLSRVLEILDEVPDTIVGAPEVTPLVIDRLTALADATPDYDALAERVEDLERALRDTVAALRAAMTWVSDAQDPDWRNALCALEADARSAEAILARPSTPPTDGAV